MCQTYKEKLLHPKWQKKRLSILQRDKFTCQGCGDIETTLHIHHLKYNPNREPWDIEDEYLITYCSDCHLLIEFIKENHNEQITDIKSIHKRKSTDGVYKNFTVICDTSSGFTTASVYYLGRDGDEIFHQAFLTKEYINILNELINKH